MTTTLDARLAKLVKDYLSTETALAAGVPPLPVVAMDAGESLTLPCLLVMAEEEEGGRMSRRVLVSVELRAPVGTAAGQMTGAAVAQGMAAVFEHLRDDTAFYGFLGDLSEEEVEGWHLLHRAWPNAPMPERDDDPVPTLRRQVLMRCTVALV